MAIIFVTKGKTNWKYLAIVFVLGVIAGAGTLWLTSKQGMPPVEFSAIKKPEKIVKDETVNWKTYRNEEYGFEIKYPRDWYAETEATSSLLTVSFENHPPGEGLEKEDWQLIVLEVGEGSITQEWVEEKKKELGVKIEEITINSEKGYKATNLPAGISFDIAKDRYLYSFFILFPNPTGEKVFNQMLSTFRFLDSNPPATLLPSAGTS